MPTPAFTPASTRGHFAATVTANIPLCTEHYRLRLHVPHFPPSHPGQFIQLDAGNESSHIGSDSHPYKQLDWTPGTAPTFTDPDLLAPNAYLRRPFSIAAHEGDHIDIIHRVVGKATRALEPLTPGTPLTLLGPLGKGFTLPTETSVLNLQPSALLVGGGVGIPPMFYLAAHIKKHRPDIAVTAFVGAQRKDLIPLPLSEISNLKSQIPLLHPGPFGELGYPTILTTDDGSYGQKGFITIALAQHLETLSDAQRQSITIYCCGPTPMMKATAKVAATFNVNCQVSLEQPMACGMGTCQSCVIKYHPPGSADWVYKLTCTDGPVFNPRDLHW